MVSSNQEISSDFQLSRTKKNHHLRKAFNKFKTHAAIVADFTLQWQDLEDHFVFIHNSILSKLEELQQISSSKHTHLFESQLISQESHFTPILKSQSKLPDTHFTPDIVPPIESNGTELIPTIQSLAKVEEPHFPGEVDIDEISIEEGKALLVYLIENSKQHESVRLKIVNALKASTKPEKLVIETVRWFYPKEVNDRSMNYGLNAIRNSCVLLLEEVMKARLLIETQEKEEVKDLLLEWMAKIKVGVENSLEVFGLLLLVGAFGLKDCVDADEILNFFSDIVKRRKAPDLFRSIGLEDRAPEFIEKLISQKKRFYALRFIYEFGLAGKFSPVTILEDHLMEAKTSFKEGQNSQQTMDMALKKEMAALRDAIQCIERYKLESKYSPDDLRARLQQLLKQNNNRKEGKADATVPSPKDQRKQQSGNKRAAPDTEFKLNEQKKQKANWTSVSMEGASSSFVNQASANLLMQPPHHQRGLYLSQDTPYFPSPRSSMLPSASQYASVGTASTIHGSHPQSLSLFSDRGVHFSNGSSGRYGAHSTFFAEQMVSPVGSIGLATSIHATQNTSLVGRPQSLSRCISSTSGQYHLASSEYTTPQMGSTLEKYGLNIREPTGSLGSSITPLPTATALNVNTTNRSVIWRYSKDAYL